MRLIDAENTRVDTRLNILSVATRLFAESGINAVSLRDIAEAAKVNGAAVNYHFGSKELLVKAIFRRLFLSLNRLRLEAFDACEARVRNGPLQAEGVVRALVAPMVRFSMSEEEGGIYFARLLFHSYGLQPKVIEESILEQVDDIALRFVEALQMALPKIPRAELFWRYDFAIGACLHVLIDPHRRHRLKKTSKELCDTDDGDMVIERLVASILASLTATPPKKALGRKRGAVASPGKLR
jgi:AcrR family transcriptional regulator